MRNFIGLAWPKLKKIEDTSFHVGPGEHFLRHVPNEGLWAAEWATLNGEIGTGKHGAEEIWAPPPPQPVFRGYKFSAALFKQIYLLVSRTNWPSLTRTYLSAEEVVAGNNSIRAAGNGNENYPPRATLVISIVRALYYICKNHMGSGGGATAMFNYVNAYPTFKDTSGLYIDSGSSLNHVSGLAQVVSSQVSAVASAASKAAATAIGSLNNYANRTEVWEVPDA